jgi:peptidoglycan/LPS O-acetylase OafA/YrhL
MRYRAEIDGLRALAVVPVILFHAGFKHFSGGFVGVDVFFVISGYLITSIILEELEEGTFSGVNFYERRARRILPALFFVMAVCIPLAWIWLTPFDMKRFAQSLAAVSTFSSNILFWRESGYFDTATELKPLIHTWSLAVEEQYYILFPLFLMLTWKLGKRCIIAILIALAVIGLGIAQWGAYNRPTPTFYLLPTRGWEILLGSFVAFYFHREKRLNISTTLSQIFSLLGIALILLAILAFDKQTPFPSLYTLIPTLGTVLVITFTNEKTLVHRFLSNKAFVGMGLISYSVYLWHQPLFAFVRHRNLHEPSSEVMIGLSVAAVILGYLSWRFVEHPFRKRGFVSRRSLFVLALALSIFFVTFGLFVQSHYKPPTELKVGSETVKIPEKFAGVIIDGRDCSFPSFPNGVCRIIGTRSSQQTDLSLFVVGDSHARVLTEAIYKDTSLYTEFFDLSAGGCPFLLGMSVYIGSDRHFCSDTYQSERLAYLSSNGKYKKVVILSARLPLYLYGNGFDNEIGGVEREQGTRIYAASSRMVDEVERQKEFFHSLTDTLIQVLSIADRVFLILPSHTNGWDPTLRAEQLSTKIQTITEMEQQLSVPSAVVENRVKEVNSFILQFSASNPRLTVIDPRKFTCSNVDMLCYGFKDGEFLFADSHHLSLFVNQKISSEIAGYLRRFYE